MWVEFVGSLLCFEGFSPGAPVFLPQQKRTMIRSRLCCMARHESYGGCQRHPCMPLTRPRWTASPVIKSRSCKGEWSANPHLLIYLFKGKQIKARSAFIELCNNDTEAIISIFFHSNLTLQNYSTWQIIHCQAKNVDLIPTPSPSSS